MSLIELKARDYFIWSGALMIIFGLITLIYDWIILLRSAGIVRICYNSGCIGGWSEPSAMIFYFPTILLVIFGILNVVIGLKLKKK